MFTRIIKNGGVWIESTDGFSVVPSFPNGNASCIIYHENGRSLVLDAVLCHDSADDREADIRKMTLRQREQYFDRMIMLVYVPDVLRWQKDETISTQDRSRILGNVRTALEFDNAKPRFVKG